MKKLISIFLGLALALFNTPAQDMSIGDIRSEVSEAKHRIIISSDSEIKDYRAIVFENPARVAVDIHNSILTYPNREMEVKGYYVYRVRSAQNSINPNITRVVADLNGWTDYTATLSPDKKQIYLDFDNGPVGITEVNFAKTGTSEGINIDLKHYREPVISQSSSKDRLVLDIPMARFENIKKIMPADGTYIKSIECTKVDSKTARVSIGVKLGCLIETKKREGGLRIEAASPESKNLRYTNKNNPELMINSERINFNYFNYKAKTEGNRYTVTVPSGILAFGTGRIITADRWFDFIDFVKNEAAQTTDIILNAKKTAFFTSNSVKSSETITIQALPAASISTSGGGPQAISSKIKNKRVVIDPGHGGDETGATFPFGLTDPNAVQVKEKDLNLDISLKLYDMLKKAGIKVDLTRKDDSAVGLVERAEFANKLNASLFVSVHNNAGNSWEKGTMTLFYPTTYDASYGITGERVAQIVQEEMLKNLGTLDRGVWKRPRLAVLNNTKMPAILAEVAYITDASDREKLTTEDFKKKAAEALYNGIIKTLNEMVANTSTRQTEINPMVKPLTSTKSEDSKPRNINGFTVPSRSSAKCDYKGNSAEQPSIFDLSIQIDYAKEKGRIATLEEQRKEARQVLLTKLDEATVNSIMEVVGNQKDLDSWFWEDEIENDNFRVWVRCLRYTGIATIDVIGK